MGSVVFVAGARPNFMKVAPIMRELTGRGVKCELVHTGQHYDFEMSGVFFEQLGLAKPDAFLDVGSGLHGVQTGKVMIAFEEYLVARREPPSWVVVVGDVNSTMACALVAVKRGVRVAHVEAGLRSFDRAMPEEINRITTDAISDLLLVSDPAGLENLRREGIPDEKVKFVGNVMIDSLVQQLPAARGLGMARKLGLTPGAYALTTLHRPSNVDDSTRLRALVDLLAAVGRRIDVVFPVHPRTASRLDLLLVRDVLEGSAKVRMIPPLGYREFLGLMAEARLVLTDSGGVQEETTYLGVPCVTLRTTTERPVTTAHGTNILVGESVGRAFEVVTEILASKPSPADPIPGWDGHAAKRVVDVLLDTATVPLAATIAQAVAAE
jgi:UDP-N-acetylglucosamine 2-epimerase (non-hydrolysing)